MDEITIGARLRTLRRWRGKSQVELAGLAGLSPSFLSMVETGQRPLDRRSVAELEPTSPPGRDLGDGALDVGPVCTVPRAAPGRRPTCSNAPRGACCL